MNTYAAKRKSSQALRHIGTWATWWWGISCLYVLWLVVESFSYHAAGAGWLRAIGQAFKGSPALQMVLSVVLAGWIAGGYAWLRELKRLHISRKVALKDLFLTIRK